MSDRSRVSQNWFALVSSGNIRYQALPAAEVPCAVGAWAELFVAAASPVVPWWIVGFQISFATGLIAEQGFRISLGYGGAYGAAIAAGTVVITNYPIVQIGAVGASMRGSPLNIHLPFPVKVPVDIVDPGSRAAYSVVDNPVGGAVGATSCRVIIATAIGS